MSVHLVWFRNDLRIEGDTALFQAIDQGPFSIILQLLWKSNLVFNTLHAEFQVLKI